MAMRDRETNTDPLDSVSEHMYLQLQNNYTRALRSNSELHGAQAEAMTTMQRLKAELNSANKENERLKTELAHIAEELSAQQTGAKLREGEQQREAIQLRNECALAEERAAKLARKLDLSQEEAQRTIQSLSHSLEVAEAAHLQQTQPLSFSVHRLQVDAASSSPPPSCEPLSSASIASTITLRDSPGS